MSGKQRLVQAYPEYILERDDARHTRSRPGAPGSGGPNDPSIEARIARLEDDMREIKTVLGRLEPAIARIDAQIPHLATQAELARRPTITAMWTMGIALFALTATAMAAGAVYLALGARLLHATAP